MTVATIEVNATRLYYEDTGTGMPILFIHGLCGHANVWDEQVRRLSTSFRCIAYDRRGHTRSAPVGDVVRTVGLHADDAAALIKALDLTPVILVGSSGGARIGVDLVLRYPELFRSAVLSEPPLLELYPPAASAFVQEIRPRIEAALARGGPMAAVDAFFDDVCAGLWKTIDEERRQTYRDNHFELFGDLQMPPYRISLANLAHVQVPCRMLIGARTLPIFREITTSVARAIPGAELVEIPESGHVTYAENPAAFATAVREFATRVAGGADRGGAVESPAC